MLTGENWNENMYEGIVVSGTYWMVVYYLVVVIIGIFIVLNLFLAILLADFDAGEPPDFRCRVAHFETMPIRAGLRPNLSTPPHHRTTGRPSDL